MSEEKHEQESDAPITIIGAGAAGLMAAIFAAQAAQPPAAVLLLEATDKPGQKILISGGGRCNVLPARAAATDFHTDGSPNTVRKILDAWPLDEVMTFFERDLRVPLALEADSAKYFPASNRSRTVLDALLRAAAERGVTLRRDARVSALEQANRGWTVRLASGEALATSRVVLATGGLSVPATGSDGSGLALARALGHSVLPTYPALVPLTTDRGDHHALTGISLPVTLSAPAPGSRRVFQARGGFLFTHRGYSGPAVLNVSHLAVRSAQMIGPRTPISVQWTDLGAIAWDALLRSRKGPLLPLLRDVLPERLAQQLLVEAGLAEAEGSQLRREDRTRLVELLTRYDLPWTGHEGYRTAEVTGGGIPLNEVNPATLESRLARGLYLCGEMLDAFGPIGGFNFLWAWVTGKVAGDAAGSPEPPEPEEAGAEPTGGDAAEIEDPA